MSKDDLAAGVVANGPDADRVARAGTLLARVLLEDDARAQRVFAEWREAAEIQQRMLGDESPSDTFVRAALFEDYVRLQALCEELGLEQYRWLPKMLLMRFIEASEQIGLEATLPDNLPPWHEKGRRPKNGEKQHDELERDVRWFYRVKVKQPPDSYYLLGKEHAEREQIGGGSSDSQHSTVHNRVGRVKALLDCLADADHPSIDARFLM
jgi:hypothetical protein